MLNIEFCNRLCRLLEQEFSLMLNLGHRPLYRSGDALVPERIWGINCFVEDEGVPAPTLSSIEGELPIYF